mmetsp:Transcript_2776/g.11898  ORF Transcript_2776/g.11898 Transcript_2776/m.11898 type:complete len:297 (-) Transcript_2776:1970-2860(-)
MRQGGFGPDGFGRALHGGFLRARQEEPVQARQRHRPRQTGEDGRPRRGAQGAPQRRRAPQGCVRGVPDGSGDFFVEFARGVSLERRRGGNPRRAGATSVRGAGPARAQGYGRDEALARRRGGDAGDDHGGGWRVSGRSRPPSVPGDVGRGDTHGRGVGHRGGRGDDQRPAGQTGERVHEASKRRHPEHAGERVRADPGGAGRGVHTGCGKLRRASQAVADGGTRDPSDHPEDARVLQEEQAAIEERRRAAGGEGRGQGGAEGDGQPRGVLRLGDAGFGGEHQDGSGGGRDELRPLK